MMYVAAVVQIYLTCEFIIIFTIKAQKPSVCLHILLITLVIQQCLHKLKQDMLSIDWKLYLLEPQSFCYLLYS